MHKSRKSVSILMPTYNNVCVELVKTLHAQCERIAQRSANGFVYEIIVADDGSADGRTVEENREINALGHCRFIERKANSGRSAIRNFLAKESSCEWLLFIDSDVDVRYGNYVAEYLESEAAAVVCGGVTVCQETEALSHNLRYRYERAEAHNHTAEARGEYGNKCFRTTNFMARRELMLDNPFDEAITTYGYEDVMFGKELREKDIAVVHIDNPVVLVDYEDNRRFVDKTEESLRTLFRFKEKLLGYSSLLVFADKVARLGLTKPMLAWHKLFGGMERKNLTGRHPNLLAFKMYKIGYYISLKQNLKQFNYETICIQNGPEEGMRKGV